MNEHEMSNGFGGYGFLIVLILFIWLIFGNGGGMFGGGYNMGNRGLADAEKQEIIDSARTQYLIEQTAGITRAETAAGFGALGAKVDFYEYQNLRDQLAQERTKNVALETRLYSDAKFGALEAQLASIQCGMLKQPPVFGVGTACVPMYVPPFPTTSSTTTTG